MEAKPLKIVVVGDGMVGKTTLLASYTTDSFTEDLYVTKVFDNYAAVIKVDRVDYRMSLWDTMGQEEFKRLRPLTYKAGEQTDCFLLCYAVDNQNSFDNVMRIWHPELKHYCPQTPIVLVGTKTDLRSTTSPGNVISSSEGQILKSRIKAAKYVECSSKTRDGLVQVFEEAVRASIVKTNLQKSKLRQCRIV